MTMQIKCFGNANSEIVNKWIKASKVFVKDIKYSVTETDNDGISQNIMVIYDE
jgi:hypothetical protein